MNIEIEIVEGPLPHELPHAPPHPHESQAPHPSGGHSVSPDSPGVSDPHRPPHSHAARGAAAGLGAMLIFEGIVRPTEDHKPLQALDYEAYRPMAENQLRAIGERLIERHGLLGLICRHSVGRVAVGGVSFRLVIASRHRREAIDAMDTFIDELKRDVPIWKSPVWR